ncbi:MAG: germination protein GerHC [Paenibacillus sp.]|nr:germination protein GerHC [Paenibacillus sp.]
MRRWILCWITVFVVALSAGCADRSNVEDITFSMLIGIDLDDQDRLVFSLSSPVFSKEAKDKEEEYVVHTKTLRMSREEFDRTVGGTTVGAKAQVILLGKRVLQHEGWFKLLDPLYRDVKNTVQTSVVLVDGTVSDIVSFQPTDKERLPLYMSKLIRTAHKRNITVLTTLQELHRQMFEKGMTPSLTVLRKDGYLKVMGTALLEKDGRYLLSLSSAENKLLTILSPHPKGEFPLMIKLPSQPDTSIFNYDRLSFNTTGISTKTKVSYTESKFKFDLNVKLKIALTEMPFLFDVRRDAQLLEQEIEQELEDQFARLIKKIQTAKIDPAGLGLYARAKQYQHWKPVQDQWGEAFARSDVNVEVKVKIMAMGAIK